MRLKQSEEVTSAEETGLHGSTPFIKSAGEGEASPDGLNQLSKANTGS